MPAEPDRVVPGAAFAALEKMPRYLVSGRELRYLGGKLGAFGEILKSASAAEVCLKMDILRTEPQYALVDYAMVLVCFQAYELLRFGSARGTALSLIDNYGIFDSVAKNPRFLKILFKCAAFAGGFGETAESAPACALTLGAISHILTRFPDLRKMNFMFIKSKRGGVKSRFPEKMIRDYF